MFQTGNCFIKYFICGKINFKFSMKIKNSPPIDI